MSFHAIIAQIILVRYSTLAMMFDVFEPEQSRSERTR